MTILHTYEFKKIDRLRSICVIPKDDIFILMNSRESIKFSLNYPKYIYINCIIESLEKKDNYELNMPGC